MYLTNLSFLFMLLKIIFVNKEFMHKIFLNLTYNMFHIPKYIQIPFESSYNPTNRLSTL